MIVVFILLLVSLLFAIPCWFFLIKMNHRQGRTYHNQRGPSLGRWTPGQSITCVYCQTVFVMPQNAQQRVERFSLRNYSGNKNPKHDYWVSLEPDDYCPNKKNHSPKRNRGLAYLDQQMADHQQYLRAQPRINDAAREPRDLLLVPGDRITHPVFGVGVVLAVQGEGEKAEATVKFDSGAVKTLATAWAPITRHE